MNSGPIIETATCASLRVGMWMCAAAGSDLPCNRASSCIVGPSARESTLFHIIAA